VFHRVRTLPESVVLLAAEHHRHVHRVRADHRADADTPEGGIHDVRAVIDGSPGLIHEFAMERVDVVVPDLSRVLAVPAGGAGRPEATTAAVSAGAGDGVGSGSSKSRSPRITPRDKGLIRASVAPSSVGVTLCGARRSPVTVKLARTSPASIAYRPRRAGRLSGRSCSRFDDARGT